MSFNNSCAAQFGIGELYFDYRGKHMRLDIAGATAQTNFTATIFQDYKSMNQYYYDRVRNVCVSMPLNGTLEKPQIPKLALHAGEWEWLEVDVPHLL